MILVLKKDDILYYSYEIWEKTYIFEKESLKLYEMDEDENSLDKFDIIDYINDYDLEYKLKDIAYENYK